MESERARESRSWIEVNVVVLANWRDCDWSRRCDRIADCCCARNSKHGEPILKNNEKVVYDVK
jgi:hypothetical protein